MIYEPRWGLVVGGLIIMGPGLSLAALALLVGNGCIDDCGRQIAPLVALAGVEAVGLTVLIVGLVGHDVPAPPTPQGRNLTFLPLVTPQAEGLSVLMHW